MSSCEPVRVFVQQRFVAVSCVRCVGISVSGLGYRTLKTDGDPFAARKRPGISFRKIVLTKPPTELSFA